MAQSGLCVTAGTGWPVLLIPGWPQTWYAWRPVIQALAAQGLQAIAVDPPSSGQSDRPEHGYDIGHVAGVLHQVMGLLGFERYSVVGHDVGMWIAYALASDHPYALERLALTEAVIAGRERAYLNYIFDHRSHRREALAAEVYEEAPVEFSALLLPFLQKSRD